MAAGVDLVDMLFEDRFAGPPVDADLARELVDGRRTFQAREVRAGVRPPMDMWEKRMCSNSWTG
ncbi:hypothetical protein [Agromyces larvae]|uniref:Uncharacterized protein n=1 Tax=Agromyces larvae TaxID=2929802 RepID=A0ABY4C482_9MICO|nr:hypothetical protein [Agromyces larvae]UOE44971.1 hypothetical protein MTO99_04100 [Agromyces larvae]